MDLFDSESTDANGVESLSQTWVILKFSSLVVEEGHIKIGEVYLVYNNAKFCQ